MENYEVIWIAWELYASYLRIPWHASSCHWHPLWSFSHYKKGKTRLCSCTYSSVYIFYDAFSHRWKCWYWLSLLPWWETFSLWFLQAVTQILFCILCEHPLSDDCPLNATIPLNMFFKKAWSVLLCPESILSWRTIQTREWQCINLLWMSFLRNQFWSKYNICIL